MSEPIRVDDSIFIELISEDHVSETFRLIEKNRTYLKEWLTWLDFMATESNFSGFVQKALGNIENGTDYAFVILSDKKIIGRIGIYYIDSQNRIGSIGYWLDEDEQGKGIITKACKKIMEWGFNTLDLNRIEIKCAVENTKSRAIPERLGFTFEGIIREGELLNGKYIDLNLFSMLKREFKKSN